MNRVPLIWIFICIGCFSYGLNTSEKQLYNNSINNLLFTENKGQIQNDKFQSLNTVFFKLHQSTFDLYITSRGLSYIFYEFEKEPEERNENNPEREKENKYTKWSRVDIEFVDAAIKKENIIADGISPHYSNYYIGNKQYLSVHQYAHLTIKNIYPGIDWVVYSKNNKIKYEFVVAPGANPSQIVLRYWGADKVNKKNNSLLVHSAYGTVNDGELLCFQENKASVIPATYATHSKKNMLHCDVASAESRIDKLVETVDVTYQIKAYDQTRSLVIDPELSWGTFLKGQDGIVGPMSADHDATNNIFITGYTNSQTFPTLNVSGSNFFQGTNMSGLHDGFITAFSNMGVLLWSTYFGGSGDDWIGAMVVDNNGKINIAGKTSSPNFPTLTLAGAYNQAALGGTSSHDGFVTQFNTMGFLNWSTYFGGNSFDAVSDICVDGLGNLFIVGTTSSNTQFPLANPGGGAFYVATLGSGGIYNDAFIARFDVNLALTWSTYYGGQANDEGYSVTCDNSNTIWMVGKTFSINSLPTANPSGGVYFQGVLNGLTKSDAFIAHFDANANLTYGTYFGGSNDEGFVTIAFDGISNLWIEGETKSTNLPSLTNPGSGALYQSTLNGTSDLYFIKVNTSGVIFWCTYYGGSNTELLSGNLDGIDFDACGNTYFAFHTSSPDLATLHDGCTNTYVDNVGNVTNEGDVFLIKLSGACVTQWATYIGGESYDHRNALTIDNKDNIFIAGEFVSYAYGTTNGLPLFDPGNNAKYDNVPSITDDGFVVKFSPVVPQLSLITTPSSSCFCDGIVTASLSGSCASPYDYTWSTGTQLLNTTNSSNSVSAICPGIYTVSVVSNCGVAFQTASVNLGGIGFSVTTSSVINNPSCFGYTNGAITQTITGGPSNLTYVWMPGGNTTISIGGISAGTYTLSINDGTCTLTQTYVVTEPSALTATVNTTTASCGMNNATAVSNASGGTSGYSYVWFSGQTGSTSSNLPGGPNTLTVTDANGCTFVYTTTIAATPPATVEALYDVTINQGEAVNLVGVGTGTLSWSPPAELSCVVCDTTRASPTVSMLYYVTLLNSDGCIATDSVLITVLQSACDTAGVFLPNAFSPNGDGANDKLFVYTPAESCVKSIHLTIFNRWGEVVFESTDPTLGWDGLYKGKSSDSNVYHYIMSAALNNGNNVLKEGTVTLLK